MQMAFFQDSRDLREILPLVLPLALTLSIFSTSADRGQSALPSDPSPAPYSPLPTPYSPMLPLTYSHLLPLVAVLF